MVSLYGVAKRIMCTTTITMYSIFVDFILSFCEYSSLKMGFSTADGFWFGVFWIILHLDELYTNRNGNRNSNKYNVYVIKAILAALIKSILIVCEIDDILHTHCLQCARYINAKSKRNRSQKTWRMCTHPSIVELFPVCPMPFAFCFMRVFFSTTQRTESPRVWFAEMNVMVLYELHGF